MKRSWRSLSAPVLLIVAAATGAQGAPRSLLVEKFGYPA